ncbi:hypothetical protein JXR93_13445, partial [bacterium]|nr:hypothetical protein [bacterium]
MLSIDWSFYYIKSNEYRNMPTINCFDIANFIQLFNLAKPNIIYIFENNSKKKITLTQSIRNSISNKKNRKESIIIDDLYNLQTVDKDDIISSRFYQKLDQREFGFIYNNILFTTSAYNYSCILNLLDGVVSNYFDEKIYLQAKKGKFESIEEYNSLTKQGFKTKQDYNDAIDSNYFNHFDHYKKIYISNIIKYPNFDNVSKLYYFCKNGEFDNYSQFIDAIERGFNNKAEFEKALEDGFDTKKEYDIAQESGFKLKKDFDKANSLGIKSKTIYDIYNNLETKGKLEQFIYSDISFLYYQISLLEDGDKIS